MHRRPIKLLWLVSMSVVLALVAIGCGGDGGGPTTEPEIGPPPELPGPPAAQAFLADPTSKDGSNPEVGAQIEHESVSL